MMQFLYSCEARKDWSVPDEEARQDLLALFRAVDVGFRPFVDDAEGEAQADGTTDAPVILANAYARLLQCLPSLLDSIHELDRLIAGAAENWTLERMVSLDRNLLRVAVYEMLHDGISHAIAINEAIELAKTFGEHDSPRFINGVLDRIHKQLPQKD